MKIIVDTDRCEGHGRCVQHAPDVFGYDDLTNLAFVLAGADLEANAAAVNHAVQGCPERALSIVESAG